MANRLLCTSHLLVHQQATQLVKTYNSVVSKRSDLTTGTLAASAWVVTAVSGAWATGSNDGWIGFVAAGLSYIAYTYQHRRIKQQFDSLPLKSKSGRHAELIAPDIEKVINFIGEGKIEMSAAEIAANAVKIVANLNPDIE